ncbi:PH domain-containing protein [Peribacillus sp. SCS-155]|uniref:PH domain-containing protein n=1 Tax=Peribacillus sedimenti TaxID=3115297 RepID=UPI003906C902
MLEPQNKISKKALKVWRLSGVLISAASWVAVAILCTVTIIFNWDQWIIFGSVLFCCAETYLFVKLFPDMKWKRWRYEVRESEIEIQSGIWVITRTLVPMVRVQHVETEQGPLLRKYNLASVKISTAATLHEIPALEMLEADELRHRISRLASVEEEDV